MGKDKNQGKAGTQNGDEGAGGRLAVTGLRKKGAVYVHSPSRCNSPAPLPVFQIDLCSDRPPAVSQCSETYILRSVLDPVPIERTTLTNKPILEAEAAEAPEDVDGTNPGMRTYGCLIAWNSADQLSAPGILHVILALNLVGGKVITDGTTPSLCLLRFSPFSHLSLLHISPLLFLRDRSDVVVWWTSVRFFAGCVSALQYNSRSPHTPHTACWPSMHITLRPSAMAS